MAIETKQTLVTAEQLFDMGEDSRKELVRGELRDVTPSGFEHGAIALEIGAIIRNYVRSKNLGIALAAETGFVLEREPDTVRAPDVSFVSASKLAGEFDRKRFLEQAPDLAVEIISPSDTASDVQEKVDDYLKSGVKLIWLGYPSRQEVVEYRSRQEVRILSLNDQLDGWQVLPGFSHSIKELFSY